MLLGMQALAGWCWAWGPSAAEWRLRPPCPAPPRLQDEWVVASVAEDNILQIWQMAEGIWAE